MKAAYIEQFGGPEVIRYGDLPDPPGPGQIVVDACAASVNGADWKVRGGELRRGRQFPLILGRDFSGVVSALGEGVTDLRVGDDVFGVLEAGREGAYAEKIAIGAAIVAKKPAALSHVDAAALGAHRPHRLVLDRGHAETEDRRDDPDPGRRRRRRAASPSSSPSIIGARVITTASAANRRLPARASAPTRSSTTTRPISPRP